MHLAPVVDRRSPLDQRQLRRRLAWGLLALEQPPNDLKLSLEHFLDRWGQSQPPSPPRPWQIECLRAWRRSWPAVVLGADEVSETLVQSLRLENGRSLDGWLIEALEELSQGQADAETLRPWLRWSWQQLSLGVQRLRQSSAAFGSEAQAALRAALQTLQRLDLYFQDPQLSFLEEAQWRWAEAMQNWDQAANLCLSGLQPACSCIYWGLLLEALELEGDLRALAHQSLAQWFSDWSSDLAWSLGPYQPQILSLQPALQQLGLAMLGWQKLLPGWPSQVAGEWAAFCHAAAQCPCPVQQGPAESQGSAAFRWLEGEGLPKPPLVRSNPWRSWLQRACFSPPQGSLAGEGLRLQSGLTTARLLTTLVQPELEGSPVWDFSQEAGYCLNDWLQSKSSLSEGSSQLLESLISALENLVLQP